MADGDWSRVEALPSPKLTELFDADPGRLGRFSLDIAGLHFDFSKTHLTADAISAFAALAEVKDLAGRRDKLFAGEKINTSEGRPVGHTMERGEGDAKDVGKAKTLHERMRSLIDAIEAGALGPIRHVLHTGIGGSALGPNLLVDALGRGADRYDVAVVSNVDGVALEDVFARFDPAATLLAVASKTFTTTETMLNAESVIAWMTEHGVEDPYGRVIALTAAPDKAIEWGVDETRVLPFSEAVGGRYSLWSSIGFPAALKLGWDAFEELLEGAAEMDRHFRLTPLEKSAPALAAFADLYYTQVRKAETRATFAYDERLKLLPPYLQQLEMESNGKGVTLDGQPLGRPSCQITWGGVGTDAQHAVFQLLHQGTHLVPVEFVAVIEAGDTQAPEHHKQLLLNAFAQGAALMKGRHSDDGARNYLGDRPSSTILIDELTPRRLGALIAFYEHRVFTVGTLLGINSFDQFGVELGKEMAKAAAKGGGEFDPSTTDLIARAGLKVIGAAALAMALSVAQMKDHRRVLIVAAPRADNPALKAQENALTGWRKGAANRDLTVVEVIGDRVTGASDPAAALRRAHQLAAGAFIVVLIGKDGHEAYRSGEPVLAEQLEATIDAMPMRQAGLR